MARRPDFLAYDIRDLPSRFADARAARGMPVLTWTVRTLEPIGRARPSMPDQIIYEVEAAMSGEPVFARLADGVAAFAAADWDRCAGTDDPFLSHAFLSALEDSGSATAATGWRPLPIAIDGTDARPAAVMPAYVKSHSLGEYVFDHGWADAYERAGGDYYPKLQIAVPFTPVPGRRLLAREPAPRPGPDRGGGAGGRPPPASPRPTPPSSPPDEVALFERAGWLIRTDSQFHWLNEGLRASRTSSPPWPRASARRSARSAPRRSPGWRSSISPAPRSKRRIGTPSGLSTRTPARANGASPISPAPSSRCSASGLATGCC